MLRGHDAAKRLALWALYAEGARRLGFGGEVPVPTLGTVRPAEAWIRGGARTARARPGSVWPATASSGPLRSPWRTSWARRLTAMAGGPVAWNREVRLVEPGAARPTSSSRWKAVVEFKVRDTYSAYGSDVEKLAWTPADVRVFCTLVDRSVGEPPSRACRRPGRDGEGGPGARNVRDRHAPLCRPDRVRGRRLDRGRLSPRGGRRPATPPARGARAAWQTRRSGTPARPPRPSGNKARRPLRT